MIERLLSFLGGFVLVTLVAGLALGLFDLLAILVYWTVRGAMSL